MDKELNPINQGTPYIGNDGKPYSSVEELTRANMVYENRQYDESALPKVEKELNPINQGTPYIGNDGKPYSPIEELTRANMMYENRQYAESIIPKVEKNEFLQDSLDDFDVEPHHRRR